MSNEQWGSGVGDRGLCSQSVPVGNTYRLQTTTPDPRSLFIRYGIMALLNSDHAPIMPRSFCQYKAI